MSFEELVKSRHSAMNFQQDVVMQESDFERIINLTKLAPSTYNLQPTNYLVVMDQSLKEKVYELSYKQYKIKSASAVVFVLVDKNSFSTQQAEKIYGPMKMLKILDESQYESTMGLVRDYVDELDSDTTGLNLTKEIYLSGSISAGFFLLSAKHEGFDTCPMHVFNREDIKNLLNIPDNMEPILMVAVGKSVEKKRQRGYRKRNAEMLTFNKF